MSKKKATAAKAAPQTDKQFVLSRGRQLPLHLHFVTRDYDALGQAHVIISRRHNDGHISYAVFLADLLARGIKDCYFQFHVAPEDFQHMLDQHHNMLIQVNYELAHNIVFAAHDFAVEHNLPQQVDFQWIKQFLEEDEAVELVDIPVGDGDGQPFLIVDTSEHYAPLVRRLTAAVGEHGFRLQVNHQGRPMEDRPVQNYFAGTHADPSFEEANISTEEAEEETPTAKVVTMNPTNAGADENSSTTQD